MLKNKNNSGRQATGLYGQTPKLKFCLAYLEGIFLRPFLSLRSIYFLKKKIKKAIALGRSLIKLFILILQFRYQHRFGHISVLDKQHQNITESNQYANAKQNL